MPTYAMSCFKFPKKWWKEVSNASAQFWCGQKQPEESPLEEVVRLSDPKAMSGLGYTDLMDFNLALLTKMAQSSNESISSVGEISQRSPFSKGELFKCKKGCSGFLCWSRILEAKEVLKEGELWKIGDGNSADIWTNHWVLGCINKVLHKLPGGGDRSNVKMTTLIERGKLE